MYEEQLEVKYESQEEIDRENDYVDRIESMQKKLKEIHHKHHSEIDEIMKEDVLYIIEKRHKILYNLILLIRVLEKENNNFKSILKVDIIGIQGLLEDFKYDYYLVLKNINEEINILEQKIKNIDIEDSEIIKFLKERLWVEKQKDL